MILAEKSTLRMRGLEHFQAKWIPVRVKKMRYNNDLEVLSDSAESETALEPSEPLPLVFAATSNRLAPDVPLFAVEFVSTNGHYGYICACLDGEFNRDQNRVSRITSVQQLALLKCRQDQKLPKP
jgi:Protein of unknown function (DUF4087)